MEVVPELTVPPVVASVGMASTVTVVLAVTEPQAAVMVAVPGLTPVTRPKLLTVATFSLEEVREMVAYCEADEGRTCSDADTELPT